MRDGAGRWVVVNETGEDVLRDPDPVRQMLAAHLAAAAPGMREALAELVKRLRYLELPYSRDAERVRLAEGELSTSAPPIERLLEVLELHGQQELDLTFERGA